MVASTDGYRLVVHKKFKSLDAAIDFVAKYGVTKMKVNTQEDICEIDVK